jgi:hypothetical protein
VKTLFIVSSFALIAMAVVLYSLLKAKEEIEGNRKSRKWFLAASVNEVSLTHKTSQELVRSNRFKH